MNIEELKIRSKSTYEFSAEVVMPLPESSISAISGQDRDNGLIYSPMCDAGITRNLEEVLSDPDINAKFAGLVKKKGFERSSTGLSVATKNVSVADKTHTITVSISRTKG